MSEKSQMAVDKMKKLNKLLSDLESSSGVSVEVERLGAIEIQPNVRKDIDIPLPPGWLACSGCGCWCVSSMGAGDGCGEHAGHWA